MLYFGYIYIIIKFQQKPPMLYKINLPILLPLLLIFANMVHTYILQFKISPGSTKNLVYANMKIICNSDGVNFEIFLVPNATASHFYQGEACPNNKYSVLYNFKNRQPMVIFN